MKLSFKIQPISLLIFMLYVTTPLFSQNDTLKKRDTLSKPLLDSKKTLKPVNLFKIEPKAKKTKISFKPKKELPKFKPNDKNYYDLFNKPKKSFNIRGKSATVDSDVLVVKYFNGKRITNRQPKIKSTYSLGVFHTASSSVRIEVRDFGLEDGDRIRIYLNGEVLEKSIKLTNRFYFINIPLKKGYNAIAIKALNQGYTGPNTAELEIYDETGTLMIKHTWNIKTGQVVSTSVVKN